MSEWIRTALDVALIGLVAVGLVQATRLLRQLAGLRQGRIDMERFVQEFSSTVYRAEAGIKGLRQAARESGDDLEKLVGKATMVRDELQFITESADQIAERLSDASHAARIPENAPIVKQAEAKAVNTTTDNLTSLAGRKPANPPAPPPASRAEKELLQALEKLG